VRYLIISDIHANLEALDAVVADARGHGFDQVACLGDLVGYGASPDDVIDRVWALNPVALIRGNHDKVCAGLELATNFNDAARAAAEWTYRTLRPENRQRLADLPKGPVALSDEVEICHGAPFDEDFYLFNEGDAARAIAASGRRVCVFGHTHVPAVYSTAARRRSACRIRRDRHRPRRRGPAPGGLRRGRGPATHSRRRSA
jgi:predicted phosphodiesterase